MLVPMRSSGDFFRRADRRLFCPLRGQEAIGCVAEFVPRMLRSAPLLRRGALLIRGPRGGHNESVMGWTAPYGIECARMRLFQSQTRGPGSAEQRNSAAPRPGHA